MDLSGKALLRNQGWKAHLFLFYKSMYKSLIKSYVFNKNFHLAKIALSKDRVARMEF